MTVLLLGESAKELKEANPCRGWKMTDEDISITEIDSPGPQDDEKCSEVVYTTKDGRIVQHQQWCKQLQCHASWGLDAAGNVELLEVTNKPSLALQIPLASRSWRADGCF